MLSGQEVKAIKAGKVSIKGAYVKVFGANAWLVGALVAPYQAANVAKEYDPQRHRQLLFKRSQLKYLIGKAQEAGLTLVPIKLYTKNNFIKLELGIGRGKKKYDKRESIKQREVARALRREK